MEELKSMSKTELLAEMQRLEECLLDVAQERSFFLSQTNLHIGGRKIKELRYEWKNDEQRYRDRIASIKDMLRNSE